MIDQHRNCYTWCNVKIRNSVKYLASNLQLQAIQRGDWMTNKQYIQILFVNKEMQIKNKSNHVQW